MSTVPKYTYRKSFTRETEGGVWEIVPADSPFDAPAVWSMPHEPEHWELDEPPMEFRAKYEALNGADGSVRADPDWRPPDAVPGVVELMDDADGSGFNQPCRFGYLVDGYAVYCHNERWLYAPRKCRRTWYTGGERRDEDCPGFLPREEANR